MADHSRDTTLALLAMSVFLLAGTPGGLVQARPHESPPAGHPSHDTHCPDPSPSGDPCPDDCSCTCCPGHGTSLWESVPLVVPDVGPPAWGGTRDPGTLIASDHRTRIFRPPRHS